jgi:hypothetical protein
MPPPMSTANPNHMRYSMQKPPTPPSSADARRSMTPTTATAEPTTSPQAPPSKPMMPVPSPSPLESQRVSALLELNRVLLQEVIALQTSGKAGTPAPAPSPPQSGTKTDGDAAQKVPLAGKVNFSKEYIEFVFFPAPPPPRVSPISSPLLEFLLDLMPFMCDPADICAVCKPILPTWPASRSGTRNRKMCCPVPPSWNARQGTRARKERRRCGRCTVDCGSYGRSARQSEDVAWVGDEFYRRIRMSRRIAIFISIMRKKRDTRYVCIFS